MIGLALLLRLLLRVWAFSLPDAHDPDGDGPRSLRPSVLRRFLGRGRA